MKKTGKILILIIIGFAMLSLCTYFIYQQHLDSEEISSDEISSEGISLESPYNFKIPRGYSDDIEPYIDYLKTQHTDPVDYVIGLFDKYDIVVLGERNHKDITQYELFYKIISDKRFIQKFGYVFTEVGSQTINNRLNKFLQAKDLNKSEVNTELIDIYRNISSEGYWEKYNFYYLLNKIHYLNNSLPKGQQVQVNCSDMPIDWDNVTHESYIEQALKRDKIMADFISSKYKEQKTSKSNKKFLVIMNSRHAFKEHMGSISNTTAYLNEEFPGKVANIMINTLRGLPGSDDKVDVNAPMQGGKWDAAFRYLNNKNTAFDFNNSPFGEDRFDYYDSEEHKEYKYKDIFNGFIFYYPLEKHLWVTNIPGIMDSEFIFTFAKRLKMIYPNTPDLASFSEDQINQQIKEMNTLKKEFYPDILSYNSEIQKWLKY